MTIPAGGGIAELLPTRAIGRQVATTTAFTVRSVGIIAAVALASGVTADPPITFTVEPGATPDVATITPTDGLSPGTRYRLRMTAPDGSLGGTWAFRTDSPLHVVGRLPDDETTDVPLDTGIETTFDQDGSAGFAGHFSIQPATAGRLEQHDRTWVFAPNEPLRAATVYTVTVSPGVQIAGSDRILETAVRWQFETTSGSKADAGVRISAARPVLELRPGEQPQIAVAVDNPDDQAVPASLPYDLYQIVGLEAAASAAARLLSTPSWTSASTANLVDPAGLTRVATGRAALTDDLSSGSGIEVVRLPVKPDPGWYLLQLTGAGRPMQVLLQVTDLAAYVLTTETRTAAWVNDLATLAPVAGATVSAGGGTPLGQTDAQGLLTAPTPGLLGGDRAAAPNVLTITAPDGRGLLAPLGQGGWGYVQEQNDGAFRDDPSSRWWLLLSTDRSTYRATDTVHAWGVVRARADLKVPAGLQLRLSVPGQSADAPLKRIGVKASTRGVFSGDLAFADLPAGSYEITLYAGSELLRSTWFDVGVIRKPAYAIDVTTDRHAYVRGDTVAVSGSVAFYDGSRAPGIGLLASTSSGDATWPATVAADGQFRFALPATSDGNVGWMPLEIDVRPSAPEEGAISGSTEVAVFPSTVWLDGTATLVGDRLHFTTTLSKVDFATVEAQLTRGEWPTDPAGAAIAAGSVHLRLIELVPVRTQTGTTYDFITKKVAPVYEYDTRETTVATRTLATAADGTVDLSLTVPDATVQYRVELEASDSRSRVTHLDLWAGQDVQPEPNARPYLTSPTGCGMIEEVAGLGATTDLTVHDANGSVAAPGHFLFLVGERGLTDAVVQSDSTYHRPFTTADLPSYAARAVRLTAHGYEPMDQVTVRVDPADKTLGVTLTPAQSRYAPGGTAAIEVRTTGPDGKPVAADVVVRAVDEKLFTIGAAIDVDALSELLVSQPSGFLQSFASHPLPFVNEGGCGSTGGGREDFRDLATFQRVQTGSDGLATVAFHLPDDLTSWHVTATAVSANLDAGSANVLVPVGLPFFVDAIVAPEYLAGDMPVLLVRAYGDSVALGDAVRFVVSAPDLGIESLTVDGRAGSAARIALPALSPGDHRVTIAASSANGTLTDALVRTVHVIPTRLQALEMAQQVLGAGTNLPGGSGLTTYVVSDAGRASLLPILQELVAGNGPRFDQAAAADLARQLLIDEFNVPASNLPDSSYDADRYSHGGVTLLPYSTPDLTLTALAAIVAPERIDTINAGQALSELLGSAPTRERTIIALAGRAALGEDVLDDLRALQVDGLTVREQIWLGLGYLESGDEPGARAIERGLLGQLGQQLGPWVRLEVGSNLESTIEATGLMVVLAGELGDPLAGGMASYVQSQPSTEQVFSLELLGYVRGSLDRLSRTAASFAWTWEGQRHEQALAPGVTFSLTLTADQRQSLSFVPLAGDPVLTATWIGDAAAAELPSTPGLSIVRTVTPASDTPSNQIVRVRLTITFSATMPAGCYTVTDLLPSGLAPIVAVPGWPDDPDESRDGGAPYAADGQRVSWCAGPIPNRTVTLAYSARVVTPGTYRWEPAVIQAAMAPGIGAATAVSTYTIR